MEQVTIGNKNLPDSLRIIAVFPLAFFIAHLLYHYNQGAASNIFWMCNISNLTLALGLFLGVRIVIKVSVLWLMLGFPLWIIDLLQFGQTPITTFLVHIGGGFIGLYTLKYTRFNKGIWFYAFLWYLAVQHFCRMSTPALLNINLAHSSRALLGINIDNYFLYWLITCLLAATLLFTFGVVLEKAFPNKKQ